MKEQMTKCCVNSIFYSFLFLTSATTILSGLVNMTLVQEMDSDDPKMSRWAHYGGLAQLIAGVAKLPFMFATIALECCYDRGVLTSNCWSRLFGASRWMLSLYFAVHYCVEGVVSLATAAAFSQKFERAGESLYMNLSYVVGAISLGLGLTLIAALSVSLLVDKLTKGRESSRCLYCLAGPSRFLSRLEAETGLPEFGDERRDFADRRLLELSSPPQGG